MYSVGPFSRYLAQQIWSLRLVLQLIACQPMYGYQLVQAIRAATNEGLTFGEGCIYPILHRLESQKLLTASKQAVSGRVRVVYCVTRKGKAQLAETLEGAGA